VAPAYENDIDVLAHITPIRIGDGWSVTDGKPGDFAGNLLTSPVDDLDRATELLTSWRGL
jgi:hypothetical protein